MYYKPTQLFSYLKVNSAHPNTTWSSVIKGLGTNLRSHCNDGTINIHIRIQAALLMRQGYNQNEIFKIFNLIAKKSQNDILYKHTNYFNPNFLQQAFFYDKYEQIHQDSQPNYTELKIDENENNNNLILLKICPDMYKLRKNDPRIINLVVPFHSSMDKLKPIILNWHKSLLSQIPNLAAALPLGCIRLVQKRQPNLKERLAPKYSKSSFYYGNISCPINCSWFANLKCNLCKQTMKDKYKISDIHKQSTTKTEKINEICNNKTKHATKIKWSSLTKDTNLTSTNPNSNNTISDNINSNNSEQKTNFSQKQAKQTKLILYNKFESKKYSRSSICKNISEINNQIWNKINHTNLPPLVQTLQLHEMIELMTINCYIYKNIDTNNNPKLSINILACPWTHNHQFYNLLNINQINNTINNCINKFETMHKITYPNLING